MSLPEQATFTGHVNAKVLRIADDDSRLVAYEVTFAPEARTHWHSHPHGQLLLVTSGAARIQLEGHPVAEIDAGDSLWIPPAARHWHGAAPAGPMTHIAMQEAAADGSTVIWSGPVSDAAYNDNRPTPSKGAP
ncbi:(R)-mandelonitrile lyase [Streptomyces smyrnaeus]|uniref:Cupin domain-containing protein n=1 Tax=Streptomyces smyrnaeus TaxID=1387713 RepID=A0ABS3XV18_9ACTN|nr:cupin domain-containing protein [Streptomyces smyrnaeus]MBO8199265.1 cupin domain-containing protein [Streptomyces smyrnaeus]